MYLMELYNNKKWQVLLWPRLCLFKFRGWPDGGIKVMDVWMTPLLEIRRYCSDGEIESMCAQNKRHKQR